MSIQTAEPPAVLTPPAQGLGKVELDDWELDISIVESGPAADKLIRMTDDGCNSTCATACVSCP